MDPKHIDQIMTHTEDKPQLIRRIRIIKDFLNYKFYTGHAADNLKDSIEHFKAEYLKTAERSGIENDFHFLEDLPAEFFAAFNIAHLKDQMAQLEGLVTNADIVTLYLPFQADDVTTTQISQWIKQNVTPQSLIEIKYDSSLIGGCAISRKGNYRDFSLKQKVEDHQKQILDLLLSYKRQKQTTN